MKRWDFIKMMVAGRKLFEAIHRRKRYANPNHDVHLMARNLDEWLAEGIQSIIDGTYNPRFLKRMYFQDEMIDQLHLSDRILQNLLLKQLKPTFSHVMSPNCYHLHGPSGVKLATQRIKEVLETQKPQYIIRADIRSYYKSIRHSLLLQDIKQHYHDLHVQNMLENIIKNPIDTARGCINPDNGIALRGPLSQFFSALYLKPLDHAFDGMDVTYIRYQDDLIILCKTKRQMERCKQRMMDVLSERRLRLSRKKTRIGAINQGFHFLGIHYLETQPLNRANVTREHQDSTKPKSISTVHSEHFSSSVRGGGDRFIRNWLRCFSAIKYRSACANVTKRSRASQTNGSRWVLYPKNQALSCPMVRVVGENSNVLDKEQIASLVFRSVLGCERRLYRARANYITAHPGPDD
jgi:retron-type reverse transcriptase